MAHASTDADSCLTTPPDNDLVCRRITNRESARRMRKKRAEEKTLTSKEVCLTAVAYKSTRSTKRQALQSSCEASAHSANMIGLHA